ncbi:MAG: DUF4407 domain-containing protein [Bacteroidota bacterium]
MSGLTSFFLFCAGADQSILKRTPTDVNKYSSIGATVFFTGIFAAIAGGFALYSVFKSVPVAIFFGVTWGLMIFNLDRYIVMSIKKKDNKWQELGMAFPRLVLAVLIAFVIAKPLELKLFESEINSELVLKEQQRFKEQEEAVRTRYSPEIERMQADIEVLNAQIEAKRAKRDQLNQLAIEEADGTGGSGMRNLGPIYKAKKKDADNSQKELENTLVTLNPEIEAKRTEIKNMEALMNGDLTKMEKVKLDGFAARLDALGNLASKSSTIFWASIFITLLFIAIETAPLFVKLISERSPYDFRLDQHESMVKNGHSVFVNRLNSATQNENQFLKETERYQTLQAIAAEKELIKKVIQTEVDQLKEKPFTWQAYRKLGRKFS